MTMTTPTGEGAGCLSRRTARWGSCSARWSMMTHWPRTTRSRISDPKTRSMRSIRSGSTSASIARKPNVRPVGSGRGGLATGRALAVEVGTEAGAESGWGEMAIETIGITEIAIETTGKMIAAVAAREAVGVADTTGEVAAVSARGDGLWLRMQSRAIGHDAVLGAPPHATPRQKDSFRSGILGRKTDPRCPDAQRSRLRRSAVVQAGRTRERQDQGVFPLLPEDICSNMIRRFIFIFFLDGNGMLGTKGLIEILETLGKINSE